MTLKLEWPISSVKNFEKEFYEKTRAFATLFGRLPNVWLYGKFFIDGKWVKTTVEIDKFYPIINGVCSFSVFYASEQKIISHDVPKDNFGLPESWKMSFTPII